ncbi:apolipoprotein N-acyltransferase [Melioribacter sp. Ez-97]|uniref:apolipoprotein N-acyltransferase n=1 Tax=Melioribacter sp. Ez-97 TaxID=3423434 RepID=UPI003EDA97C4
MKIFKKYRAVLTPRQKSALKKERLMVILSGLLLGLSFPPFPVPVFIFFAFIPYFKVIENRNSLGEINRISYLMNFVFSLVTLYWVGSWTKEADPFLMISGALLLFVNPALYLIPSTLYYFSKKTFGKKISLLLFPFFWLAFEFLYSVTDLRFPWLALGNGVVKFNYFIQIADLVGAYGLTLIILFINVFIYLSVKERGRNKKLFTFYSTAAALVFIVTVVYGSLKVKTYEKSEKKIKVGLIQPNFNPWKKWEAGNIDEQLQTYLSLSEKAVRENAKLIVWPESALPVYLLSGNYESEVGKIHEFCDRNNVYLMTGMPDINFFYGDDTVPEDAKQTAGGIKYTSYNSILFFSPFKRDVEKYAKIMLVPFGERVPFLEELPFFGKFITWQVGISSWNVGKEIKIFEPNKYLKVAGVICIESIYPYFVSKFADKGAEMIVVVTNDSWYGYSSGPFQHKEFAQLRAVENRRALVRAANGGISCIIDPLGRTISQTELFERTFLTGNAELRNDKTFFMSYPLLFPSIALLISGITFLMFLIKRMMKNEKND